MRVHELAKELGVSSKELIDRLQQLGLPVKSHMAVIPEDTIARIRSERQQLQAEPSSAATQLAGEEQVSSPEPAAPQQATAQQAVTVVTKSAPASQPAAPSVSAAARRVEIHGSIVVKELADILGLRPNQLVAELMGLNVLASINQRVDFKVARKVAEKHGVILEHVKPVEHRPVVPRTRREEEEEEDRPEDLLPRPPVVTFLGHVDHGKTSLLDRIRRTSVAQQEHGGITQHIGAYSVETGGRIITFLDTPGHAAFTAMRARGANLTDIAVIVVAADDGVMPQTEEAIQHARAANVAIMVALNKIDLPTANPERVKSQLQALGLTPEEWGGETICVPVSALTGQGVEHLLEMILLLADMLELKANPNRRAQGFVVEGQQEPGMGPSATLLVKRGTLQVGDTILCAHYVGKVRALINDQGVKVKSAGPSIPVRCLGLPGIPPAGSEFRVYADERLARELAAKRAEELRAQQLAVPRKASLQALFEQLREKEKLELNLIVKADTQGTAEAVTNSLRQIKSDKVSLNIILTGVGNITENDVMLASASNAIVLGFHVGKEAGVESMARHEGVEIRLHTIIYELLDEVRNAMAGLLAPKIEERVLGRATVKQIFSLGKKGKVAGCAVTEGVVTLGARVRVKRGKEVLHEGHIESLRRHKDDVSEVRAPLECGIRLSRSMDFDVNDVLECYEITEVKQTL